MNIKPILVILFSFCSLFAIGQQPRYTFKHFVHTKDTSEFKDIFPKDGFYRKYILESPEIWDIDDDNTTFIRGGVNALLCFEGQQKNNKKEGLSTIYLIDSTDHNKRYKIWEQTYSNDQLNGEWRTYTLRGTLANLQTFQKDSLNGITRNYWIDGKKIIDETEYFNGHNKYIQRLFYPNGKLQAEIPYENEKLNGVGKKYYENGTLNEVAGFKNGVFDGTSKYFYPNGQLWIEHVYKDGKHWAVIANYTAQGKKRDAGTLINGNGTIIYYNEDGTVREIKKCINGIEQ